MPLLDLISEGNVGLMKAVERFDPTKGAKLSTSTAPGGSSSPSSALWQINRRPSGCQFMWWTNFFASGAWRWKLQQELGHEPTDEELADELGMRATKIAALRTASAIRPISLETPFDGDEDSNLIAETVKDENAVTPYEQLEQKTTTTMVRQLTSKLAPRELEILGGIVLGWTARRRKLWTRWAISSVLRANASGKSRTWRSRKMRKSVEKLETIRFCGLKKPIDFKLI